MYFILLLFTYFHPKYTVEFYWLVKVELIQRGPYSLTSIKKSNQSTHLPPSLHFSYFNSLSGCRLSCRLTDHIYFTMCSSSLANGRIVTYLLCDSTYERNSLPSSQVVLDSESFYFFYTCFEDFTFKHYCWS